MKRKRSIRSLVSGGVKICGMTRLRDADAAVGAGANAIGLVFAAGSKRRVTPARAKQIVRRLPNDVMAVGVFVNTPIGRLVKTARTSRLAALQLHGDETPADCREARLKSSLPVIKAFAVASKKDLKGIGAYRGAVDAILLDSKVPGKRGGTGQSFDWKLARGAKRFGIPMVLSGGLNPQKVGQAIRVSKPNAVDVSGGVEAAPGVKDPIRVRAFVRAVWEIW